MRDRDMVRDILVRIPQTRGDDGLLVAHFMQEKYHETDVFRLADKMIGNAYETCRRARQKIQQSDPTLRPEWRITEARKRKEEEIREEMRWF